MLSEIMQERNDLHAELVKQLDNATEDLIEHLSTGVKPAAAVLSILPSSHSNIYTLEWSTERERELAFERLSNELENEAALGIVACVPGKWKLSNGASIPAYFLSALTHDWSHSRAITYHIENKTPRVGEIFDSISHHITGLTLPIQH